VNLRYVATYIHQDPGEAVVLDIGSVKCALRQSVRGQYSIVIDKIRQALVKHMTTRVVFAAIWPRER